MTEAVQSETEAAAGEQPAEAKASGRHVKQRRGQVVSAKMDKTVIVAVERRIRHRKYKKYITVQKRYAAHDEIGVAEGDYVLIRETRPLSKTKRWRVSKRLGQGE